MHSSDGLLAKIVFFLASPSCKDKPKDDFLQQCHRSDARDIIRFWKHYLFITSSLDYTTYYRPSSSNPQHVYWLECATSEVENKNKNKYEQINKRKPVLIR